MTETWNPGIPLITNQVAADILDIEENFDYLMAMGGYWVDYSEADQGAAGSGNSIKDLVDAIGTTKKATLFLKHNAADGDTTTYALGTSETITSNITLDVQDGAIIAIANGVTLTIQGNIKAGNYQIFSLTGTGTIDVSNSYLRETYPEWMGGIGDDSTDCQDAINKLVIAGKPVYLTHSETYLVKSAIAIVTDNACITGKGTLKADSGSFAVQTPFVTINASNVVIEDIILDQDDTTTGWSIGVGGTASANTRLKNLRSTNVGQAFIVVGDGAVDTHIENCYQKDEGYGVLVNDPTGSSGLFIRGNHFEYDGDAAGYGDGIEINAPTNGFANFDISNNYIAGYIDAQANNGIGIGVAKGYRGVISNNIVEDVEADGIHVENESYEINITGNTIRDTGPTAYTADGNGIMVSDSFNVNIANNNIKNVNYAYGILVQAYPDTASQNYGNKIIGNTITNVDRAGISIQGQIYFNVIGNSIYGASEETDATYSGIGLREGSATALACENGVIANNIIKEVTNTLLYGIDLKYVTADVHENIQVINNDVGGCTNKIFKDATVVNGQIRDNLVVNDAFNNASYATATTLAWHEHFNHTIYVTAAAVISLRQASPGMRVLVYSTTAAAVSVKAHTNDRIILNGLALDDADKVTSASGAGNFIELIYESSAGWATINRSGTWTDGGA